MKKMVCSLLVMAMSVSAWAALYETSFEVSEGWAMGSLGVNPTQQPAGGTWTNNAIAQVQTFFPRTGENSVYFNSSALGNHIAYFTPDTAYTGSTVTVTYYAYLPDGFPTDSAGAGAVNHQLRLKTDATELKLQMDNFSSRNRSYISAGLGSGGSIGLQNYVWLENDWTEVSFTLDFDNDTYTYSIDSNVIANQVIGHDISQLEQISIWHRDIYGDNFTIYMDDFAITPEPATFAVLGLGGLMIRRKK